MCIKTAINAWLNKLIAWFMRLKKLIAWQLYKILHICILCSLSCLYVDEICWLIYRVAQKTGPAYFIANILKTPRPNCVKVGELSAVLYVERSNYLFV